MVVSEAQGDADVEASILQFPSGFVWGSATSAYQIEGAATVDGKGPSIWDTFTRQEGRISDGSDGSIACDHYNRYADDVALMSDLGLAAYRFSLAWTRIIPDGDGKVNTAGLDFYDRLVDTLLAAGIRPLPTLYHWDLPQALEDKGGWLRRQTAQDLARYAEVAAERLGDRIDTWITLNEPFVSANHGYVTGEHAPGRKSMAEGFTASHHLLLGHGLAVERIRAVSSADVGIVLNFTPVMPVTGSKADAEAALHQDNLENRWYSDPLDGMDYPAETADFHQWDRAAVQDGDMDIISRPIDLLGINYYTRSRASADDDYRAPTDVPRNSMGWEIHPPSLGVLLRWLRDRYSFSRYLITENGAPMVDDRRVNGQIQDDGRLAYIRDHLAEVHRAIEDGCPVEGYLVWSLFDNFEWAHGYGPRFGIVEVDYETQQRIPKKSADWFRAVAGSNEIGPSAAAVADGN